MKLFEGSGNHGRNITVNSETDWECLNCEGVKTCLSFDSSDDEYSVMHFCEACIKSFFSIALMNDTNENSALSEKDQDNSKEGVKELFLESLEEFFFSDNHFYTFNLLRENVEKLLEVSKYEERLDRSIAVCDKFEDYMKNIDKLNQLVNEFKALVAITRGQYVKGGNYDNTTT